MKSLKTMAVLIAVVGLMTAGAARAAEIMVWDDIAVSTVWTANNTYNLRDQIWVLPGATLTIEPGTIIASSPTANGSGSLAICRGAKIYANGTCTQPIIFTSTNDNFTTWREACNEWGNITIMGNGIISSYKYKGVNQTHQDGYNATPVANTAKIDGVDKRVMEGLTADAPGDPKVLYGGGDDNDNSGSLSYVSLRYGGRVIGLADELNGLSLGGIGRETDIHHIEIMNNVDDGIEIWGGTVNLKYVSIWNVGDDYIDVDQGWRGKVQFALIVMGHSADAAQGSGVGDNAFEMDGAEDSDAQPVTTSTVYNATVVGQPLANRRGMAYRDGARVQFHNCIFMDLGERLVRNDNSDGDGGSGYGYAGTLSWDETWTTPYTAMWDTSNPKTGGHVNAGGLTSAQLQAIYTGQSSGNLNQISDSVFFRNLWTSGAENAYTVYNQVSALSGAANHNNVIAPYNVSSPDDNMPIKSLVRGSYVVKGGRGILPVVYIDPRAANAAVTSVSAAPDDGFFTPAYYRGAFNSTDNWLLGWTAAHQYGMTGGGGFPLKGDVNGDCVVDLADFMTLSENWLQSL